jgi:antitoxin MazE
MTKERGMVTRIIQIGNSRGIRLPKLILEQIGVVNDVELSVMDGKIVIEPISSTRKDWEIAFKEMAKNRDDQLQEGSESGSKWDGEEWEW